MLLHNVQNSMLFIACLFRYYVFLSSIIPFEKHCTFY